MDVSLNIYVYIHIVYYLCTQTMSKIRRLGFVMAKIWGLEKESIIPTFGGSWLGSLYIMNGPIFPYH